MGWNADSSTLNHRKKQKLGWSTFQLCGMKVSLRGMCKEYAILGCRCVKCAPVDEVSPI